MYQWGQNIVKRSELEAQQLLYVIKLGTFFEVSHMRVDNAALTGQVSPAGRCKRMRCCGYQGCNEGVHLTSSQLAIKKINMETIWPYTSIFNDRKFIFVNEIWKNTSESNLVLTAVQTNILPLKIYLYQ
jgi:hypothetical protein